MQGSLGFFFHQQRSLFSRRETLTLGSSIDQWKLISLGISFTTLEITMQQRWQWRCRDYYRDLLGTPNHALLPFSKAQIQAIHPFRCSDSLASMLSSIPLEEEITKALFSLPKNKWLYYGVLYFVGWFWFDQGILHVFPFAASTVISLIPKISGAETLANFRPISLCNTVCEVISRILSSSVIRWDLLKDVFYAKMFY